MIHSSFLRKVDLFTRKHFISELLEPRLFGEVDQEGESILGDEVLREVEEDLRLVCRVVECAREFLESMGVLLEEFFEDDVAAQVGMMLLELLPCFQVACLGKSRHCDVNGW